MESYLIADDIKTKSSNKAIKISNNIVNLNNTGICPDEHKLYDLHMCWITVKLAEFIRTLYDNKQYVKDDDFVPDVTALYNNLILHE